MSDFLNVKSGSWECDSAMKTGTLLTLFAATCVTLVTAETPNYTAAEAAKHVGEVATIIDRVDGVHQSGKGNIFLNMGGKYPNQAFTARIPSASAGPFSNRGCVWKDYPVSGESGNHCHKRLANYYQVIWGFH
jgi:hypothetical protein